MITIYQKVKILTIAHRGASSLAPENTLKAFRKAIELKADYIEFDVRQSKDREIVIMHDGNTLRITGHFGVINKMTLSDLRELDCGEGEKIPTLKEIIEVAKGKIGLNCEIKARGFTEKIIKILKESDMIESTIISSFKHDVLLKIQKLDSRIKLASLEPTRTGWINSWISRKKLLRVAIKNNFYAINPFYKLVNFHLVEKAHKNNIKVFPWTVNSESTIKKLIKMDVDGIITNNVSRVQDILKKNSK
ncbi:MAG: glycerophosphodiester phosphodiesterase [Promethearchaeota archaeon]|jgi:glycerophosphoryl diester phosphodiesterase